MLTQQQARLLCDAHEVFDLLDDEEEIALLEENNPGLLDAYFALHRIAVGAGAATDSGDGEAS